MSLYDSFESIKSYLDIIQSPAYTNPGRFKEEDLKYIESQGFLISHHSFVDGKVLSINNQFISVYSEKAEGLHSIKLKGFPKYGFDFYDVSQGEDRNEDPIRKILKREVEKDEKWFILKYGEYTSIGLIEEKVVDNNIVVLFELLNTFISRNNYTNIKMRLVLEAE